MKTNSPAHPSSVCLRSRLQQSSRQTRAFTLVETVIVVALVALLFSVAAPYTMAAIQSASLSSAGDTLMQKISLAQQRATTENRPIGLDFFYYNKDEVKGCHAIQLISYNPATNAATPLEPPVYWSEGRAVLVEGALSPMFSTNVTVTSKGPATLAPFKNLGATFYRILFYPNGSTSLKVPLRMAYFTLISTKNYTAELSTPPPNFYTVQIDPITGRGHSYRP
jgi:uncharacterized protein (TIGR02596 family)